MSILAAERIQGMMTPAQLSWLAEQAKSHRNIVEVGCYRGRTTTVLCSNTEGKVTAVDTWGGSPGLMEHIEYMQDHTGDPEWLFHDFITNTHDLQNLRIIRLPSLEAAKQCQSEKFDMIFIDALHDYQSVQADIRAWWPLIQFGGLLCGHDYHHREVREAVNDIFPVAGPEDSDFWGVIKA